MLANPSASGLRSVGLALDDLVDVEARSDDEVGRVDFDAELLLQELQELGPDFLDGLRAEVADVPQVFLVPTNEVCDRVDTLAPEAVVRPDGQAQLLDRHVQCGLEGLGLDGLDSLVPRGQLGRGLGLEAGAGDLLEGLLVHAPHLLDGLEDHLELGRGVLRSLAVASLVEPFHHRRKRVGELGVAGRQVGEDLAQTLTHGIVSHLASLLSDFSGARRHRGSIAYADCTGN